MGTNGSKDEKRERANAVYDKTRSVATMAMWAEGSSAVIGAGVPLLVDGIMIGVYSDMWNDIRGIYGKGKITGSAAMAYLKPNLNFLFQDFIFDTVIGNVPVIGIPFNVAFAKATTWRAGVWFGALAALGDSETEPSNEQVSRAAADLIRLFFPPTQSVFDMEAPDREMFVTFIAALDGQRPDWALKKMKSFANSFNDGED
ncbi:hypothetical protein [Streptomyces justiciae]|uniref:Uncharacterized protein n=1 Tax=Streptomyces justiciae TaxID=2780140 RepID=A0ABU3MA07_9ACTN|nr:hypothetical protein [Streptomyces justiciae]MDT7847879.1 hypothetical protein [Streptomyces justiciae]